jgi:hypothetical protein
MFKLTLQDAWGEEKTNMPRIRVCDDSVKFS